MTHVPSTIDIENGVCYDCTSTVDCMRLHVLVCYASVDWMELGT